MTTTDQDLRALTYLARRLRDETHGCARWDETGTFDVFKRELAGQNLLIATQRVIGHATDPEAQTPGAIKRPFVPAPAKDQPVREPFDESSTCATCYQPKPRCRELAAKGDDGHPFIAIDRNRAVESKPPPFRVHNHDYDPGCIERLVDGRLRGHCVVPPEDTTSEETP